jgi:hypothetical protein
MRHLTITFRRHDDEAGTRIHALTPEEAEEAIQESYSNTIERQANYTLNTSHSIYASETASVFRSQNNTAQPFFKVSSR